MSLLFGVFGKIGHFIASFGKKKTTIERLEQLDKEIKEYEKYKQKSEINEKKYIGALLLYSIVLYILGAIIYYIYLMPKNLADRLKTLIPFLIIPLIIFFIRKFLKWYYIKRTANYAKKLVDLKEEKKTILEEVKEKETYKKAREILERFSTGVDVNVTPPTTPSVNSSFMPSTPFMNSKMNDPNLSMINSQKMLNSTTTGTNLVHRNVRNIQNNQASNLIQNQNKSTPNISQIAPKLTDNKISSSTTSVPQTGQLEAKHLNQNQSFNQQLLPPPPPPAALGMSQARTLLPRPIINPNRTFLDKILDFMIGEGPNNRYALICRSCHFHNGMALKEEFEYIAFRCAYCLFYNEARKTKLCVPKLNNVRLTSPNMTNNNINNTMSNNENNLMDNDSTLSSSNSFEEISEPISGPQATSSKSYKPDEPHRKNSLTSALTESNQNGLSTASRRSSKSMDTLSLEKNTTKSEDNKENDSSDDLANGGEIETN